MHVEVTTTVNLIGDNGREVQRVVSKTHTASFATEDATDAVERKIRAAASVAQSRSIAALKLLIGALAP